MKKCQKNKKCLKKQIKIKLPNRRRKIGLGASTINGVGEVRGMRKPRKNPIPDNPLPPQTAPAAPRQKTDKQIKCQNQSIPQVSWVYLTSTIDFSPETCPSYIRASFRVFSPVLLTNFGTATPTLNCAFYLLQLRPHAMATKQQQSCHGMT